MEFPLPPDSVMTAGGFIVVPGRSQNAAERDAAAGRPGQVAR
jgi:hypothetical protein